MKDKAIKTIKIDDIKIQIFQDASIYIVQEENGIALSEKAFFKLFTGWFDNIKKYKRK